MPPTRSLPARSRRSEICTSGDTRPASSCCATQSMLRRMREPRMRRNGAGMPRYSASSGQESAITNGLIWCMRMCCTRFRKNLCCAALCSRSSITPRRRWRRHPARTTPGATARGGSAARRARRHGRATTTPWASARNSTQEKSHGVQGGGSLGDTGSARTACHPAPAPQPGRPSRSGRGGGARRPRVPVAGCPWPSVRPPRAGAAEVCGGLKLGHGSSMRRPRSRHVPSGRGDLRTLAWHDDRRSRLRSGLRGATTVALVPGVA